MPPHHFKTGIDLFLALHIEIETARYFLFIYLFRKVLYSIKFTVLLKKLNRREETKTQPWNAKKYVHTQSPLSSCASTSLQIT